MPTKWLKVWNNSTELYEYLQSWSQAGTNDHRGQWNEQGARGTQPVGSVFQEVFVAAFGLVNAVGMVVFDQIFRRW